MRGLWIALGLSAVLGCTRSTVEEPRAPDSSPPLVTEAPPTPVTPSPEAPPSSCAPHTCASGSGLCGVVSDGCGGVLDCGACAPPATCTPLSSCGGLGSSRFCGLVTDNCGSTLDCGTCSGAQKCGAAEGSPNACATPPALASCTGLAPIADLEPISGGVRGVRQCYGGWCTSNGYMGRDSVTDLWGFGDDDVWAVGNGLALHWEGSSWRQVELPGYQRLQAVWGANARDVWAVGAEGVVSRWDGTRWRRLDFTTQEDLTGVSGTSAEDVWLVGPNLALHWDGQTLRKTPGWTPVEPESHADGAPFTTHVWALGPQDALAAGGDVCQRWNGQTWSRTDCGVKGARDVWASGPDDIWVVGGLYQDYGSTCSTRATTIWAMRSPRAMTKSAWP